MPKPTPSFPPQDDADPSLDGPQPHGVADRVDRLLQLPVSAIVERIREGDYALFDALFRAYHASLVEFANCYLRSTDAAQDVVADVFLRVWQTRGEWKVQN